MLNWLLKKEKKKGGKKYIYKDPVFELHRLIGTVHFKCFTSASRWSGTSYYACVTGALGNDFTAAASYLQQPLTNQSGNTHVSPTTSDHYMLTVVQSFSYFQQKNIFIHIWIFDLIFISFYNFLMFSS